MNISIQKQDELQATVIIDLVKADYQEKVDNQLKKIQRSSNIKGFRAGKAPLGMVQKLYGKSVVAEEIQNIASDAINQYIQDEKLDILGYPITSVNVESDLDIDNKEEFKFAFDLGLAPSFELSISTKDKLDLFEVEVTEKEVNEDIDYARKRHAKLEDAEISDEESIIYANVTELNDSGEPLEGGITEKPVSFVPSMIEDKKLQKSCIGVKKDTIVKADVRKLFNDNETVITSSLGIAKEGIADLNKSFNIQVTEIKSRIMPELGEDYYKEVFPGEEAPKNEEEYKNRVLTNLQAYYKNEADLWLDHEIGHLLMSKHSINLPDEFLKRWLITTKENDYNFENIDEKYEQEKNALQRRLVIDKIANEHKLEATAEDVNMEARIYFVGMYRQYGLNITPNDSFLDETINKRMADREFVSQMADRVIYRKAYDKVKELVSIKTKKVTVENYFKHVNEHKAEHGE